jgi:hypothetical protein
LIVLALVRLVVAAAVVAGSSRVAAAQDPTPSPSPAAAEAATDAADEASAPPPSEQRLVVHGYLSQAYARSNGHQVIGIPKAGSSDYRRAAVLFRASLTANDTMVVQLAQRRLGESPTMQVEPDVKVDWAFYEHGFGWGTRVRVGRLPIPLGTFSEVRYVGTLLPFYRAPFNFYQEGSFTSETLNGARIAHTFGARAPVSVEVNAFGGAYTATEAYAGGVNRAKHENALGGQLWVTTPVDGLRFGFGRIRSETKNTILTDDHRDTWAHWVASAELSRSRVRLVSEYSRQDLQLAGFSKRNVYAYAGVGLTDQIRAHVAYDDGDATYRAGGTVFSLPNHFTDTAIGLSYAARPDVVAKGEYHWNQSRLVEDQPGGLNPRGTPFKTRYFILSLSASF